MQLVCNNYDKCSEYCEMLQNNKVIQSRLLPYIFQNIDMKDYKIKIIMQISRTVFKTRLH